ncbi:MAG: ROK family transcriptional regulator [Victivallaceae bacterium]|nr:ROK family transcriptional regulator [Victivallaceae bacterium]
MKLRNHSLIKRINRSRVMNVIRVNSPIARSEIAAETQLDRKSITNFITELLDEKLVIESGRKENISGRPYSLLKFADNFVAGIYIAPHLCRGVLIDFYGNIIASHEIEYPLYADLTTICRAVENIYHELGSVHVPEFGVGISMPGSLNLQTGTMEEAVNIPSLSGVNVRKTFSAFIDKPLFLEEESRSIALAEKWFGKGRNHDDFVVVEVSAGVGMGIVAGRRLFKGAGQYAGEVGHVVIEPDGRRCRCGNKGCLETYASEPAVVKALSEYGKCGFERLRYFPKNSISRKDYERVMNEVGYRLGQGLAAVVNILCPRTIIFSGAVIDLFGTAILAPVREGINRNSVKSNAGQTELFVSELEHVDALGAATLPLANIFEVPGYFYI